MLKNTIFAILAIVTLLASHAIIAAEQETAIAVPAPMIADTPPLKETERQPAVITRPIDDNHVDYRYCLELKTDREIIECRYRKK